MQDAFRSFDKRANAVRKYHERLARGYVTKINRQGLIEHRPVRSGAVRSVWRVAFLLVAALLVFKGFLLSQLGEGDYASRVAQLSEGATVEKMGAFLMQIEPVSLKISEAFALVLS